MHTTNQHVTTSPLKTSELKLPGPAVVRQREGAAWLLSILFHGALLSLLLVFVWQHSTGDCGVENQTGGIVLVNIDHHSTQYLDEADLSESNIELSSAPPSGIPMGEPLPPDMLGLATAEAPRLADGQDLQSWLSGPSSLVDGNSNHPTTGGQVTTQVFGIKGTGSRFVYVFDRSASMEDLGGKPLRAAKRQLLDSLENLDELHQFQIVFYNDTTVTFQSEQGELGLVFATDGTKQRAQRFVTAIRGERGTDHLSALKLALALGPDVIFLLTDAEGGFSLTELATIREWNRSAAVIHAIEFGVGSSTSSGSSLRRMAEESRGEYVYKDVRTFRD